MHVRNKYSKNKPDFKALALKYPEFAQHVHQSLAGNVQVDFRSPESLRAVCLVLLKHDFGIDINLPLDRLIPTVPSRLNYLLWIEDLILENFHEKCPDNIANRNVNFSKPVNGIDIGCGASCIYSILGANCFGWNFKALEVDSKCIQYARDNVSRNNLNEKITVVECKENDTILDYLKANQDADFHFTMCNPPFYGSVREIGSVRSGGYRGEPSSVNTGSTRECITDGGEVGFITKIIEASLVLKSRIKIYTTMVGRKESLNKLKSILKEHNINNFGYADFVQGKTMRWGVAWSTDESLKLDVAREKKLKAKKEKIPHYTYCLPKECFFPCNLKEICTSVIESIKELEVSYEPLSRKPSNLSSFMLTAHTNTWSHQRKKRRQKDRQSKLDQVSTSSNQETINSVESKDVSVKTESKNIDNEIQGEKSSCNVTEINLVRHSENTIDNKPQQLIRTSQLNQSDENVLKETENHKILKFQQSLSEFVSNKRPCHENDSEPVSKRLKEADSGEDAVSSVRTAFDSLEESMSVCESSLNTQNTTHSDLSTETDQSANKSDQSLVPNKQPLFVSELTIMKKDNEYFINLHWKSGSHKQSLHQFLQFLKNRYSLPAEKTDGTEEADETNMEVSE